MTKVILCLPYYRPKCEICGEMGLLSTRPKGKGRRYCLLCATTLGIPVCFNRFPPPEITGKRDASNRV